MIPYDVSTGTMVTITAEKRLYFVDQSVFQQWYCK